MSTKQNPVLSTEAVAKRLVKLCSEGKFQDAHKELLSLNVVSIEPAHTTIPPIEGLDALNKWGAEYQSTIAENHGGWVGEPVIAGDYFAVPMGMDVTTKAGERQKMDELAVYKVADGKIISQQFFY